MKSFDYYDQRPSEMNLYLSYYGWHFNKKMLKFALKHLKIESYDKDKVDKLLETYNLNIKDCLYDYVYVLNYAVSTYYKSSIQDEKSLALFVKDTIDSNEDGLIGKICFNDWAIYILYLVSKELVLEYLQNIDCPIYFINTALKQIPTSYGFSYTNKTNKATIVYLNKHNSILNLLNTIAHESSHVINHINPSLNDEQRSSLIGDLTESIMSEFVLQT